jgi:hypothetical protein
MLFMAVLLSGCDENELCGELNTTKDKKRALPVGKTLDYFNVYMFFRPLGSRLKVLLFPSQQKNHSEHSNDFNSNWSKIQKFKI